MGRGVRSDRVLLLALLVAILAVAESTNETDATFVTEQNGVPEFASGRNQSNAIVRQPGDKVPVSYDSTIWGLTWVGTGNGNIPVGAVVGGREGGDTLYIGRAYLNDLLIPGKVHPRNRLLYVPYGGKEYKFSNYEMLVEVRRAIRHIAEEHPAN